MGRDARSISGLKTNHRIPRRIEHEGARQHVARGLADGIAEVRVCGRDAQIAGIRNRQNSAYAHPPDSRDGDLR